MLGNQLSTEIPPLSEKLKDQYCRGNFDSCARKWIWDTVDNESIPKMMLPHQHDWARQILSEKGLSITQINQMLGTSKKAKVKV